MSHERAKNLIPHAVDQENEIRGGIFKVDVTSMFLKWVHPTMRTIYDGVENLLLGTPLPVMTYGNTKVLITGNPKTTKMLANDMFWDGSLPIFGVLNDQGNGCSVTITGGPFLDTVIDSGQSDSIKFMLNLLNLLRTRQKERKIYLGLERPIAYASRDEMQALEQNDLPSSDECKKMLLTILTTRFDESELRTLCFHMSIEYDDLPDRGRANKARELVSFLDRRNSLGELITKGMELRPDIVWPPNN